MSSCAAQPQCSMKEPPAALLLRHEIDRPACASSASSESGSLELLLILHALVGATICGAQTNRSAQVERATRCSRRQDGDMRTPRGRVPVKVAVSCAAGPAQRRCIRAPGDFHQYPVMARRCALPSLPLDASSVDATLTDGVSMISAVRALENNTRIRRSHEDKDVITRAEYRR